MIIAYCFKCKAKVQMLEPIVRQHTKHNRYIYIGFCKCGSRVSVWRQENSLLTGKVVVGSEGK